MPCEEEPSLSKTRSWIDTVLYKDESELSAIRNCLRKPSTTVKKASTAAPANVDSTLRIPVRRMSPKKHVGTETESVVVSSQEDQAGQTEMAEAETVTATPGAKQQSICDFDHRSRMIRELSSTPPPILPPKPTQAQLDAEAFFRHISTKSVEKPVRFR